MKIIRIISSSLLVCLRCFGIALFLVSCDNYDEEPSVNSGYDTEFKMPDPEPMTAEDSAFVAAQQAEYEMNTK